MRRLIASPLRLLAVITGLLLVTGVTAQVTKPAQPTKAEVPPPPKMQDFDPSLEPQVTIRQTSRGTESEYRVRGKLYMVKVTPAAGGEPYFLVDQRGDGNFVRADNVGAITQPPMWVIKTF